MKNFLKDEKTRYFAIGVLAGTAGFSMTAV